MAETKYTKNKTTHFTGLTYPDPDTAALQKEILNSAIVTAFSKIRHTSGSEDYDIYFKAALSSEDETNLTNLVASHTGEPLPQDELRDGENAVVSRLKKASWAKNYCKRDIIFTTSKLNSIIENNWDGSEGTGRSLRFYEDVEGVLTEIVAQNLTQEYLTANCVETRIEVRYDNIDIEADTARLKIPSTLPVDEALWKYAMVVAGGTGFELALTNECHMRFYKNEWIEIGRSFEVMKLSPDKLGTFDLPGGHVMHFIVKHPTGSQQEFLLEGICYK